MEAALRRDGAIHGAVYLTALTVALIAMSPLRWPWYLVLPLLAYLMTVVAWPRLRRTAPRLALGRMVGWPLAVALVLAITTVVALLGFQALARPEVAGLAAGLPVAAFGSLLVAGVCFSTTNAVLEELIFRGVLWEATAAEWNRGVALGATTILFGLGHVRLSAGTARDRPGRSLRNGTGAAAVDRRVGTDDSRAHICADATIFTILFRSGAFEPVAG
jgi:membrane protease YdiL (CAAX protease family)